MSQAARRAPGPLLLSIAIHVVVAFAILNAAFHYDFSGIRSPHAPSAIQEKITYTSMAASGGAQGGLDSAGPPPKAMQPSRALIAPLRVPTAIAPPAASAGNPGGVAGGRGQVSISATAGVVPGDPDPRLSTDIHEFVPAPKTHAERVDSAVRASIYAYNDSVAKAHGLAGRAPGDWTVEKNGQKWGIDGSKIYLGKFAIPSAVLAALPIRIQGNPGETIADRLVTTRRADLLLHADAQLHDDEFRTAVKRIRERKDKERQDKRAADADKPAATTPDLIP
ncbi:MAG: hypothetical protein M3Z05_18040 [Gemmatimonadota bacterium]|nr:hypothetical protein [Gemmatimonadota bacterium]